MASSSQANTQSLWRARNLRTRPRFRLESSVLWAKPTFRSRDRCRFFCLGSQRECPMSMLVQITIALLWIIGYVLSPVMLAWGWMRWFRQPKPRTLPAILSLLGFSLASASAPLAVLALSFSLARGGFPYYDPPLMRIFGVGGLLSLAAVIFGVGGVW